MTSTYHILTPRNSPTLLSIVIPFFNEQAVVPLLRAQLQRTREMLPCRVEIIAVNDGSSDRTLDALMEWTRDDRRIVVLGLARNFGHQAAVTAGLDAATGDAVVVMDADLQDPPDVILQMLREYERGYDVVYAQRISRKGESLAKRFSAWLFYRLMRMLVHKELPVDTGDFRLISRSCLNTLREMRETHRFLRGMVTWIGFPQTAVKFARQPRAAGRTNYPLLKMLRFAWTAAVSFSTAPLRISLAIGILLALIGLGDCVYAVVRSLLGFHNEPGWTSVMAVLLLVGGGILLSIGVLGEYVGRLFEESKGRPLYVVSLRSDAIDMVPAPVVKTAHTRLDLSIPTIRLSVSSEPKRVQNT